jgi:hypothetical protein
MSYRAQSYIDRGKKISSSLKEYQQLKKQKVEAVENEKTKVVTFNTDEDDLVETGESSSQMNEQSHEPDNNVSNKDQISQSSHALGESSSSCQIIENQHHYNPDNVNDNNQFSESPSHHLKETDDAVGKSASSQMNNKQQHDQLPESSASSTAVNVNNNGLLRLLEHQLKQDDTDNDLYFLEEEEEEGELTNDEELSYDCDNDEFANNWVETKYLKEVKGIVKETFTEMKKNCKTWKPPDDFNTPLFKYNDVIINSSEEAQGFIPISKTKGQFALAILSYLSRSKTTANNENALMELLGMFLGSVFNLPINITTSLTITSRLQKYKMPDEDHRTITFDICKQGCTVYVGDNVNERECPECDQSRFKTNRKDDSDRNGTTSLHSLQFRPIQCLILKLLETEGFLHAINYKYQKPNDDLLSSKYKYMGIEDGEEYRKHKEEMHNRFNTMKEKDPELIEVSIVAAIFYDGGQIFRYLVSQFWPLFFIILNLPPNFRTKLGIGIFLLSLYCAPYNSNSESFLFELLIEELLLFAEGFVEEVNGVRYFIQLRLIFHMYDTAALAKITFTQTGNTYSGCPLCNVGTTTSRCCFSGQCHYIGNRRLLDQYHYARFRGSSRICCPAGYYNRPTTEELDAKEEMDARFKRLDIVYSDQIQEVEIKDDNEEGKKSNSDKADTRNKANSKAQMKEDGKQCKSDTAAANTKKIQNKGKNDEKKQNDETKQNDDGKSKKKRYRKLYKAYFHGIGLIDDSAWMNNRINNLESCDQNVTKEDITKLRGFLKGNQQPYTFYHKQCDGFDPTVLRDHLYYHHLDLRKQHHYQRKSNDWYIQMDQIRRQNAAKAHNGVKRLWDFARLGYSNYGTQVVWDFFHVVKNLVNDLLDHFNPNKYNPKKGTEQHCLRTHTFPTFNMENELHPFYLTQEEMNKVEAVLNCVHCPTGQSNEFGSIYLPFQRQGMLKGADAIKLMVVYSDLILSQTSLPPAYKMFFRMLSADLVDILAPQFSDEQIDSLFLRVAETLAVHEGLFPESSSSIKWHQLLDVVMYIKVFGPVRGWWNDSGERALGQIKRMKTQGGTAYHKTIMTRYGNFEGKMIADAYDFNLTNMHDFHRIVDTRKRKLLEELLGQPKISVRNNRMIFLSKIHHV